MTFEDPSFWAALLTAATTAGTITILVALLRRNQAKGPDRRAREDAEIFSGLSDGLIVLDDRGRVSALNRAAQRMTGQEGEAAIGKSARRLLPGLESVLEGKDRLASSLGLWCRLPAIGREDALASTLGALLSETTGPAGARTVLVLRDISEQIRLTEVDDWLRVIDGHLLAGTSLGDLANDLCERVGRAFGLPLLWIGVPRPEGLLVVGKGGSEAPRLTAYPEGRGGQGAPGVAGRTLRSGRAQADGAGEGWAAPTWAPGIALGRAYCVGLRARGEVVAVLCLRGHGEAPSPALSRALDALAPRLGEAIVYERTQSLMRLQSAAIAATANAIVITDGEGRVEWVNEAYHLLSGYERDQILGTIPAVLAGPSAANPTAIEAWPTLRAGQVWRGEIHETHRDGRIYIVDKTITPIIDACGRLSHLVAVDEDVTARKKAEERIRYLSNYDTLTRLPNRVLFRDRLYQAVVQARRGHGGLAVMFIDLDQFSLVNDTLGHAAGDHLLMTIASRINAAAEEADTVARVGGDEFALIQTALTSADSAASLARRLIDVIRTPVDLGGREVVIGANVGIAIYPQDGTDPDNLMKNADMAMYRAVKSGDDSCCFFSNEMNAEAAVRLSLEEDLRRALDSGDQLFLHYQLQFGIESGRPVGAEALARWTHPTLGAIPPTRFIPVAEDSGLILALGDWVLGTALAEYARWRAAGCGRLTIAVNMSAVQFRQKGLVERVTDLLAQYGVPPEDLELELTESMLMQDADQAVAQLTALSQAGIRLSIDDFGTGYSSLGYLKLFRVDKLKVDQSFVRDVTEDGNDAVIARAIINLGHSLGLEVIAEGVETPEQMAYLRREGCDVVQGYLMAYPETGETVARRLLALDSLNAAPAAEVMLRSD
ncbi:diguanylate cyclase [Rhodospirillum rubrum]|uniref:sensor domain-containing protein n=1 Tax=Rhodospirillum rubrum TaxID=1085 RepID=UPI001907FD9D|nr:EAL domain-containing protein [Rhodospirillum rubrum]MBK1664734.1 diguanylate cyclase [Rhodospirillum rubrum]MBK1676342.1 diguanylate cyclase [Rhodospirillum rubrum]